MKVAGVMPAGFQNVMSPETQIWRVLGYDAQPWACRTCHHLRMIARVKSGVTEAQAAADLDAIHGRLAAAYPDQYVHTGTAIISLKDQMVERFRPADRRR